MHPPGERLVSLITHYTRIAYASAIGVRLSNCFGEETLWQRSNWSSTSGSPASTSVGGIGTEIFMSTIPRLIAALTGTEDQGLSGGCPQGKSG